MTVRDVRESGLDTRTCVCSISVFEKHRNRHTTHSFTHSLTHSLTHPIGYLLSLSLSLLLTRPGSGFFSLRGCGRGDVGILGKDATKNIYLVLPNAAPKLAGNAKSSFAECRSAALHFGNEAFVAGNGACDQDNTCLTHDNCANHPTFDGQLFPSDTQDTFVNPLGYISKLNEPCVQDIFSGKDTATSCANTKSNTDTAEYGGFDSYGTRFNCWRNLGGGYAIAKKNTDMTALDLTYKVLTHPVNAGIGKTVYEFENKSPPSVGVWNGGAEGIGFGVCDGVRGQADKTSVGCTAELGAVMCEAYNNALVYAGQTLTDSNRCAGFVLSVNPGTNKKNYSPASAELRMLIGFFTEAASSKKYQKTKDYNGGFFKYVPITDCQLTSNGDCSRCAQCAAGKVLRSDGTCAGACPKYQYDNAGVCTYCGTHCIECDGANKCKKCHSTHKLSADKTTCETIGCAVPAKMESALKVELVGAADQPCVASQNIVPGGTCNIRCVDGTYSSVPSKTTAYSCPKKGAVTSPTIVCVKCSVADCASCPNNVCTACLSGKVLSGDAKKCDPKPCPHASESKNAGKCTVCDEGTAGTLGWSLALQDWTADNCVACADSNCADCVGNKDQCAVCNSGYALDTSSKTCKKIPYCSYGKTGSMTYDQDSQSFKDTNCKASTDDCTDSTQSKGSCTDCADGFIGSVEWNYDTQKWDASQCHATSCPNDDEKPPDCKSCPQFCHGKPLWNDMRNKWEGCEENKFGFDPNQHVVVVHGRK